MRNAQSGFTLVELVIVIIILGCWPQWLFQNSLIFPQMQKQRNK